MLVVALPADGLEPGLTETVSAPASLATVVIDARAARAPVPREFLGLSFELSSASQLAAYGYEGNFATLLRSLGPGVLRLGGASADTRVGWTDALTPAPAWASSLLDMTDLRGLRRLAERSRWHILLTIGLAHYEPVAAAREAAAAASVLGPWLAGIELGNEPDSYARHDLRALPWTPSAYEDQVSAYRRAIAASAPGLAVAGPGVSGSRAFQRWGPAEVRRQHPALLTGHHYPLSCKTLPAPTIEELLSPTTREKEGASLLRYMSVARSSATPFRMDETNTVSCGGQAGISDTFASALWAASYIARTMAAGAVGINLQGNPANCRGYSPLCAPAPQLLQSGALHAQPEWYALLLSRELIGDRPLPSRILSSSPLNLSVNALLTPAGALHYLIVDNEPTGGAATVRLRVPPRFKFASVLALRGPSLAARSEITLGGHTVTGTGSFHTLPGRSPIAVRHGSVSLSVPAASAMLVTVTAAGPKS